MMIVNIEKRLEDLGIPPDVMLRYEEPHRFYHNREHIETMLAQAEKERILDDHLFLAIIFHDIVYNPKSSTNEEDSAELLYLYTKNLAIRKAILETKSHEPTSKLSKDLCRLDLEILYQGYESFVKFEDSIFKEYQFVDYKVYKEKRIEILIGLGVNPSFIEYVKYGKSSIAVYAGSFNPFHKGHLNILHKAEQIFDKVIIATGVNTAKEKNKETVLFPEQIRNRQIESYDGLLTEFIDSLGYDVTLIRGLRNTTDLQYELTQYRYLQDFKPNIKVVSIFCDKEYEHVSSSAIRQLNMLNKENNYTL